MKIMKKNLLWDTLQAVEQVEVSFEETLKTIDNINHRYKLISSLKKLASKRQNSYEAEIQAAITAPSTIDTPLFGYTKISSATQKKRRKHKKYKSKVQLKKVKVSKTKMRTPQTMQTTCPSCCATSMEQEMPQNVVCIYEIQQKTQTQRLDRAKGNQSYRNRIRKLHEAAHRKLKQEAREINNGHNKQMQSDREQYNENYSDHDQDRKLSNCNIYCCSSRSCHCEYF